jgi:hypothetical protein
VNRAAEGIPGEVRHLSITEEDTMNKVGAKVSLGSAAAALAIGASMLLTGSGAASATSGSTDRVVRVSERQISNHFIDLGKKGFSIGDEFLFTSAVFQGGNRVGLTDGSCKIMDRNRALCVIATTIRGDQLTGTGTLNLQATTFDFPVSGGTGQFAGMSGYVHVHDTGRTTDTLAFHLRP